MCERQGENNEGQESEIVYRATYVRECVVLYYLHLSIYRFVIQMFGNILICTQ